MNTIKSALLLACLMPAAAYAKCVPVKLCDDQGKNCRKEEICSVYKETDPLETRKLAPQPEQTGKPVSLLDETQAKPKAACDDKPVAGKPRKVCK